MTPVLLHSSDPAHWPLLAQWEDAADAYNAINDWRRDHPMPSFAAPMGEESEAERQAYRDWWDALRAEETRHGYDPTSYTLGRIAPHRGSGALFCRLRRMVRDHNDQPIIGDRIVQCPSCAARFATFSQHDHFCTTDCRRASAAATAAARAKRRQDRQAKRSKLLASRTGICLACGEAFPVKRITAKTCGEACRKRLQRRPGLAEEHLVLPPLRTDMVELEAELAAMRTEQLAACHDAIRTGRRSDARPDGARHEEIRRMIWRQRCVQRLHAMAEHAPALTAWLAQQTDNTWRGAFGPGYSGVILGPELKARLGIDCYTDGDLGWRPPGAGS